MHGVVTVIAAPVFIANTLFTVASAVPFGIFGDLKRLNVLLLLPALLLLLLVVQVSLYLSFEHEYSFTERQLKSQS